MKIPQKKKKVENRKQCCFQCACVYVLTLNVLNIIYMENFNKNFYKQNTICLKPTVPN